ncbi:Glutamate decarboxylase [Diplonema papillatum]|nr:Glutamate decarboxylase [Diplonema papillatum]
MVPTSEMLSAVPHQDFAELEVFARRLVDMLLAYLDGQGDKERKVVEFVPPAELQEKLDLLIDEKPMALEEVLKACATTMEYSVKTGHVHFFNQLFAKVDVVSLMGEWLTTTLNASMYTYEVAPVFTLMELSVLERIGRMLGFENIDGIFAPGGSMSNLYSLLAARHRMFPGVKEHGLRAMSADPVVFCSEHSHYSTAKGCIMIGLGKQNCVSVACRSNGVMDPADLEAKIEEALQQGKRPMYVCATAGTTVFGAFDDITAIHSVTSKHKLWLHVDGAWGGSVMLSRRRKHLLNGSHLADSFTWNPHKMMGVPLQCSCIVLNNKKGLLEEAVSTKAGYLFQPDKLYPVEYDTGDKAYQCGRKVDIFKLWLLWKARGDLGMEATVEKAFEFAGKLASEVKRRPGFQLVTEPMCTNVCFWCIPDAVASVPEASRNEILNKVAPLVKQEMQKNGTTLVGYQQLGGLPNFWRMVCISNVATDETVQFLLDHIEKYTSKCLETCLDG